MTGPADLSADELVAHALAVHLLAGDDREVYDGCVAELRQRGTAAIRDRALGLLADPRPEARALGADVLGGMSAADGSTFAGESVPHLLELLSGDEADPLVLDSVVAALGFLGDPAALAPVLALAGHPSFRVRSSVARALPSLDGQGDGFRGEDEPLVAALLALSDDEDGEVRNWATFGLGTMVRVDGPKTRAALRARLADPDGDARAEGLVGLARRHDRAARGAVQAELVAETVGRLAVEAARLLGDPALRAALDGLLGWWDVDEPLLDAARRSCDPDVRAAEVELISRFAADAERVLPLQLVVSSPYLGVDDESQVEVVGEHGHRTYSLPALLACAGGSTSAAVDLVAADTQT